MEPWQLQWNDYYEELGISSNASDSVVKAAYRAMARDYHPDGGHRDSERMKRINEAFTVLSDPVQRRAYDRAYEPRHRGSDSEMGERDRQQKSTFTPSDWSRHTTERGSSQGRGTSRPQQPEHNSNLRSMRNEFWTWAYANPRGAFSVGVIVMLVLFEMMG